MSLEELVVGILSGASPLKPRRALRVLEVCNADPEHAVALYPDDDVLRSFNARLVPPHGRNIPHVVVTFTTEERLYQPRRNKPVTDFFRGYVRSVILVRTG